MQPEREAGYDHVQGQPGKKIKVAHYRMATNRAYAVCSLLPNSLTRPACSRYDAIHHSIGESLRTLLAGRMSYLKLFVRPPPFSLTISQRQFPVPDSGFRNKAFISASPRHCGRMIQSTNEVTQWRTIQSTTQTRSKSHQSTATYITITMTARKERKSYRNIARTEMVEKNAVRCASS
jgi:hypothetical protein